jgi:hypothetical protein
MTEDTQPPTLWPFKTIPSNGDGEQLDRALGDLMKEGRRIQNFIERLDQVIQDAVRNAQPRRAPERFN